MLGKVYETTAGIVILSITVLLFLVTTKQMIDLCRWATKRRDEKDRERNFDGITSTSTASTVDSSIGEDSADESGSADDGSESSELEDDDDDDDDDLPA